MSVPDVPECLRRDANNKAPFMTHPDCTCGLMSGECKRAGCPINKAPFMAHPDQTSPMTVGPETFFSPAANPQSTPQGWAPPWASKS